MAEKDKIDVSTPNMAYNRMNVAWDLGDTLMGGTRAMIAAGKKYLPQFSKESDSAYALRLNQSVLFDGYGRSVRTLAARPFSNPVVIGSDTPPRLMDIAEDVDLTGTDITTFARYLLQDGINYGKFHFMVEFPNTDEKIIDLGHKLTLKDERILKIRPYFVRVNPRNAIGFQGERVAGVELLDRLRVWESDTIESSENEWQELVRERIRVWHPQHIDIYERDSKTGEWPENPNTGTIKNSLGIIPLVTGYTNERIGLLEAYPPLEGLAQLNKKCWQSQSDQDNILHAVRAAFLFFAGFAEEEVNELEIGAYRAMFNSRPDSSVGFVEHSGKGIEAGDQQIERLKDDMDSMGGDVMRRQPGNVLATVKTLNTAEAMSNLESMVWVVQQALVEGFQIAAWWMNMGKVDVEIKVPDDIGLAEDLEVMLKALTEDFDRKVISRRRYLMERKKLGLYDDDMDVEEEIAEADEDDPFTADPEFKIIEEEEDQVEKEKAAEEELEDAA